MDFKIKGLKTWDTSDGGGYQFTLNVDGKKFAFVHNGGEGGPVDVEYFGVGSQARLEAHVASIPQYEFSGVSYTHNVETFLDQLLENFEKEKLLAKAKRKGTVFRLTTDDRGTFRTLQGCTELAKAKVWLDGKYPNQYQIL